MKIHRFFASLAVASWLVSASPVYAQVLGGGLGGAVNGTLSGGPNGVGGMIGGTGSASGALDVPTDSISRVGHRGSPVDQVGSMRVMPRMYGCSTSGTVTDPSALR